MRILLALLLVLGIILLSVGEADGGIKRSITTTVKIMVIDAGMQLVADGRYRPIQGLKLGALFFAGNSISLPDIEIRGIRHIPMVMRQSTLLAGWLALCRYRNVGTGSIGKKYGRIFQDWRAQAPDQDHGIFGLSGYLDWNHVVFGLVGGAASRALIPEYREEVTVGLHEFLLFEGISEAEHYDAQHHRWIPVSWEYGDLISDMYGVSLWTQMKM